MATALRQSYRAHLRQRGTLEAAYAETVEKGWDKVRVGHIATSDWGSARMLCCKEFGDKQGLGEALVLHEAERFLAGIQNVLTHFSCGMPQAGFRRRFAIPRPKPKRARCCGRCWCRTGTRRSTQRRSARPVACCPDHHLRRLLDVAK